MTLCLLRVTEAAYLSSLTQVLVLYQPLQYAVSDNKSRDQDGRSASEAQARHRTVRPVRRLTNGGSATGQPPGDCARPAGAEGRRGAPVPGQTNAGGDARQPDPDRQFQEGCGNLDCVTDGKSAIAAIGSCQADRFMHRSIQYRITR